MTTTIDSRFVKGKGLGYFVTTDVQDVMLFIMENFGIEYDEPYFGEYGLVFRTGIQRIDPDTILLYEGEPGALGSKEEKEAYGMLSREEQDAFSTYKQYYNFTGFDPAGIYDPD